MAQVWNATKTDSIDGYVQVDQTNATLVTPQVARPTGTTIALDLLVTAQRTGGTINEAVYHVANTVFCHMKFGDNTVAADATCLMLAPGERLLVLPAQYVSVVKSAGVSDGIIRISQVV
jgi:hypothetical protein